MLVGFYIHTVLMATSSSHGLYIQYVGKWGLWTNQHSESYSVSVMSELNIEDNF